jgi:hypothetical protein
MRYLNRTDRELLTVCLLRVGGLMLQRIYALVAAIAVLGLTAMAAEAKVPIPCTGEKVVKVMDLPKVEAFSMPGGQHVDLGYLYQSCFSGKWIGYVAGSSRYMSWKDGMLPEAMAAGGVSSMPQEPGFFWGLIHAPRAFMAEWAWIVTIIIIGISVWFSGRADKKRVEAERAEFEAAAQAVAASASALPGVTPRRPARLPETRAGRALSSQPAPARRV